MPEAHIEVLVEPFKENDPGPHVHAVVDALVRAGLTPDMGPFATTANGDIATITAAVDELITDGFGAGATAIQLRVELHDVE
ncbi:MAG: hypothetical protein OEU32_08010 [Acidimicrobiia bacterium]|nr:hypothetical protein [Acidimicrobiia bacterium]